MIYLLRFRLNSTVTPRDLPDINKHIDDKMIPTLEQVQGVRSARAYSTFAREVVFILDLDNAGCIDSLLASQDVEPVCGPLLESMERSGPGELMFDRAKEGLVLNAMTMN